MEAKLKKLPHSEVEIEGEIPLADLAAKRGEAIRHLQKELKLPGFREGHIPESVVVKQLGEIGILEETAEIILQDEFYEIIKKHELEVLGRPKITLTKLAPGNPVGFHILVSIFPEVTLPEYKKIAAKENEKKEETHTVTEVEVEKVVEEVRKIHARAEGKENEKIELTDEFVKKLGNFKDIADFKEKIKQNLLNEKTAKAKDKKRLSLIEKILEKTEMDLPEILIEHEQNRMLAQFQGEVEQNGLKFPEYLATLKKTEEDLRKEWRKDAENRAKVQIIFTKISELENISPTPEEIDKEAKHLHEHHKDAKLENLKSYVEGILSNEKVLKFLEEQK